MSKSNFYLIPLSILVAAIIIATGVFYKEKGQRAEEDSLRQEQAGELVAPIVAFSAPLFVLKTTDGVEVALKYLRGQNVLLVFAASSCELCQQELPDLKRFADLYRGQVSVFAIYNQESASALQNYKRQNNINFSVLIDQDGSVFQNYKLKGTPSFFLVDKSGKISAVWLDNIAPLPALEGMAATLAD